MHTPNRLVILAGAVIAALLFAGSAQAGGLYLTTFGTPDMSMASAGANSLANDASTAFHNPAGMTRLEDHAITGTLAPGFTNVKFDLKSNPGGGGDGGQQGGLVPIISGQYVHRLSDRVRLGLASLSISGAALDPNNGWAGRTQMTEISLLTLTIAPSIAVELADWFSVGIGSALTFGKLKLKLRVPLGNEPYIKIRDMDDFAAAPIVSVLITPIERLRFGVVYQGKTDLKLNGRISFKGRERNLKLDLPLAQAVRTSATWDATDRLSLNLSAGWEDWSVSETLPLDAEGATADIPMAFRDTWYLAGGVQFRPCDGWQVETGLRYDSSALKTRDRTAALPVDRVYTFGVGTNWDYSDNLNLGLSFVYTNLGKATINNARYSGDYGSNDLFLFGLHLRWNHLPWAGKLML